MSRRLVLRLFLGLLAVTLAAAAAWGFTRPRERPDMPAASVPVALKADLPAPVTIGLVITLTADPGEGSEWRDAAAGAHVAVERFTMGGAKVTLAVVDDKGSALGARAAVAKLRQRGVAAIVYASSGSHVDAGVEAAQGIPVLLPYRGDASTLPSAAYLTGPADADTAVTLRQEISRRGWSRIVVVNAGGTVPEGVIAHRLIQVSEGSDKIAVAQQIAAATAKGKADAVLVTGPALYQAAAVALVQGAGSRLPLLVTPDALTPGYSGTLAKSGASSAAELITVGTAAGDAQSLGTGEEARSMSAYLAGLRLLASKPGARNPIGDESFLTVAPAADVRSHDAVVAAVRAVEKARNVSAEKVASAFKGLNLSYGDGLAGDPLTFSDHSALPADRVVVLSSGRDALGLRPQPSQGEAPLVWFPTQP